MTMAVKYYGYGLGAVSSGFKPIFDILCLSTWLIILLILPLSSEILK
jgi:hypothetical protein